MSCSLSRSQSCPSRSGLKAASRVDQPEDVLLPPPPSSDFITRSVDEISGEVRIQREFHKHPLILSTYLNFNENEDEFNSCCFCNIYFTVGAPIYSCVKCSMFLHRQSCGELPRWIHSTRHPRHDLRLTVRNMYADCCDDDGHILTTTAYECAICYDRIGIEKALQGISISLFKNTYLTKHSGLNKNTPLSLPKALEGLSSSIKVSRELVHFHHEHPLILSLYVNVNEFHEGNETCQLCRCYFRKVETIYSCKACNFSLHESCAGLPEFIKTILHPGHLLAFSPTVEVGLSCDGCGTRIDMCPRYTCQPCDFNLHFECALDSYPKHSLLGKNRYLFRTPPKTTTPYLSRSLSFPIDDKRKSQIIFSEPPPKDSRGISLTLSSFLNFQLAENVADQIQHISHEHPLVFKIFKMEYKSSLSSYDGVCKICSDTIHPDDPIYGCHDCDVFLHESCSKIPQTMRTTWHPAHMLQLMPEKFPDCQLCNRETFDSWNYCYGCDECAIYFHCGCVLAYSFKDHKAQEHTFHLGKTSIFTCDACGITETKERISHICTSCPMQVHKQCSNSFPRTVKQKRHHHILNQTYFFEVDFDYANETCKICFNQMNKVYCMYQCHDCSYIAHVKCATPKEIVEDESVVDKFGKLVIREVGEGQKVKNFPHTHPLLFTEEEPKVEAFCDACVGPISAPFYACATDDECNFYLHKRCFELPREIQHPLDEHRLTLTSMEDFFYCYGCGFLCNGFRYSCDDCGFNIDVRCSLLSDTLKHDGHDCTLTLIDYKYVRADEATATANYPMCSVCDGYGDSSCRFSCKRCNFHLDLGCASLPKSVVHECPKHDWKAHPLQLTYGGIPDASGIYFCDMCEESRVLSHWFYDCDDCVWSNHPKCVLGEFQFKYGKTYESVMHRHKMQLVKKTLSRYNVITCGLCDKPLIDSSPLFCSTCNLYFHIYCSDDEIINFIFSCADQAETGTEV